MPTGNAGIRVTRLPVAATANDARNAGTAAATTTSVIFLDATDTLRRSAVAELVDALATGVDVVAGRGHRLAERLWRRSAVPRFDPEHGRFPWGALPDSQALGRTVSDGAPVWATPFGTVPPVSAELVAFSGALEASVRKPWLAALLTAETPVFLDDLEHAGEAEVARFAAVAGAALGAVGQDGLLDVPFETRARLWLVANGRAAEMSRMTSARWFSAGQAPTRVVDGRLLAVLETSMSRTTFCRSGRWPRRPCNEPSRRTDDSTSLSSRRSAGSTSPPIRRGSRRRWSTSRAIGSSCQSSPAATRR